MVMCLFLVPWAAQGVSITDTVIASKRKLKLRGKRGGILIFFTEKEKSQLYQLCLAPFSSLCHGCSCRTTAISCTGWHGDIAECWRPPRSSASWING